MCIFTHWYHNIFSISLSSDVEGSLSAAARGHVQKRVLAKLLFQRAAARLRDPSAPFLHSSARPNDAPSVASPVASSPLVLLRRRSEHICVSRHLPWIACVRVRAWAGHRPLPGNSSHLDSLRLISCHFFFFYSGVIFFLLTLGPGMDVPEAGKHVKKSTSQKLEDQKKVIKRKNLVFLPSLLPLPWNWILLSSDVWAASQKTNQKTNNFGFSWCPFVFTCQPWDVSCWLLENSRLLLFLYPHLVLCLISSNSYL